MMITDSFIDALLHAMEGQGFRHGSGSWTATVWGLLEYWERLRCLFVVVLQPCAVAPVQETELEPF